MPPLPTAEETPGPACNFRVGRDLVGSDSSEVSGDERTLADILKKKQGSASPRRSAQLRSRVRT